VPHGVFERVIPSLIHVVGSLLVLKRGFSNIPGLGLERGAFLLNRTWPSKVTTAL